MASPLDGYVYGYLGNMSWIHSIVHKKKTESIFTVGTGYVDDVTLGISVPMTQEQTYNMVCNQIKKWAKYGSDFYSYQTGD